MVRTGRLCSTEAYEAVHDFEHVSPATTSKTSSPDFKKYIAFSLQNCIFEHGVLMTGGLAVGSQQTNRIPK